MGISYDIVVLDVYIYSGRFSDKPLMLKALMRFFEQRIDVSQRRNQLGHERAAAE